MPQTGIERNLTPENPYRKEVCAISDPVVQDLYKIFTSSLRYNIMHECGFSMLMPKRSVVYNRGMILLDYLQLHPVSLSSPKSQGDAKQV